jgi:hypothetical protein
MSLEVVIGNAPQPPLTSALRRAIDVCEQTLEELQQEPGDFTDSAFLRATLLAVGAFETALHADGREGQRDVRLMIAATLGKQAAEPARVHGLDERALRFAEACDSAAFLCESAAANLR